MKNFLFSFFNLLLIICCFVTCIEIKNKADARYEAVVKAFEDVNKGFEYQQELIEQYKRDCENITQKVINNEW